MSKTTLKTLMRAIERHNIEKLKEILDQNPEYLLLHNEDWETPFHISVRFAKKRGPEILKLCIEVSLQNKYNVRELLNKKDMNGFTPLHVVCRLFEEKHRQIFDENVKCLIDNGIDIYIKCEFLTTRLIGGIGVFFISSIISMYYF